MRTIIFVELFLTREVWIPALAFFNYGVLAFLRSLLANVWFLYVCLFLLSITLLVLWVYHLRSHHADSHPISPGNTNSPSHLSRLTVSAPEEPTAELRPQHLQKLHRELSLANQDIEIFLYKAYHNFLGPIATIRGVCNVALLPGQEQDAITYFTQVSQVADNMQVMLEKLLEISLVHDREPAPEAIELNSFLVDYQQGQPHAQRSIQAHFHRSLPHTEVIYADPYLLTIAIEKIITNAHRFRPSKAYTLAEVFVKYHETPDHHIIRLKEYNLALPSDTWDNLFKMFHRSTFAPDDHGLGFYTARYAVRRMGGDVVIESGAGYVTFCIRLPRRAAHSVHQPAASETLRKA